MEAVKLSARPKSPSLICPKRSKGACARCVHVFIMRRNTPSSLLFSQGTTIPTRSAQVVQ